jgi:hypothetical protein
MRIASFRLRAAVIAIVTTAVLSAAAFGAGTALAQAPSAAPAPAAAPAAVPAPSVAPASAPAVAPAPASPASCDDIFNGKDAPTVSVAYNEAVYRAKLGKDPNKLTDAQINTAKSTANTIALGNVVTVEGTSLNKLFEKPCDKKVVVLFLNGLAMGLTPEPTSNPKENIFHFTLKRADDAHAAWTSIMGSPLSESDKVSVSMGFKDGFAVSSASATATSLTFNMVPMGRFLLWLLFLAGMIAVFLYYTTCSDIIRDPGPVSVGTLGLFSLSRLQGAWWFFVIVAAYLFIGTVTGDFSNSINSTALILLGIGAGTVVGSAAVDSRNDTQAQKDQTAASIVAVQNQITAAQQAIAAADAQLGGNPPPAAAQRQQLTATKAAQSKTKERLETQLGMLQGRSQGLLTDILSDANGISFHRFQIAAFTVILSVIFIVETYETLAMPTFNTTLMGMLGLSAGTYLGLKIPEATTPT